MINAMKYIFYFLVFATFFTIANATKPVRTIGMDHVNDCQEKYNISMETWTYFVDNYMTLPDESDEEHRCFVQCIMEKRRMLKNIKELEFDKKSALKEFLRVLPYLQEQGRGDYVQTAKEDFDDCMDTPPGGGKCMQNYLILKCLQAMLKKAFGD